MEPNSAIKHFRRSPFTALARRPACRTYTDRGLSSLMANQDPGCALVHHHAALLTRIGRACSHVDQSRGCVKHVRTRAGGWSGIGRPVIMRYGVDFRHCDGHLSVCPNDRRHDIRVASLAGCIAGRKPSMERAPCQRGARTFLVVRSMLVVVLSSLIVPFGQTMKSGLPWRLA